MNYAERFNRLTPRERGIVFACSIIVIGGIFYNFGWVPLQTRQVELREQIQGQKEQVKKLTSESSGLQAATNDPEMLGLVEKIHSAQHELNAASARLQDLQAGLVPPEKMKGFLQEVLSKQHNLTLISIFNAAPEPLIVNEPEVPQSDVKDSDTKPDGQAALPKPIIKQPEQQIYKHRVTIKVKGKYADLEKYVHELEKTSSRVYWESIKLNRGKYPMIELTLTICTLSMDKTWLSA